MAEENNFFKIALILGGAYIAYQIFYGQSAAASPYSQLPVTPTSPNPTVSTPSGTLQASPSNAQSMPVPTAAQLEAAANSAGYQAPYSFNVWQWNYFYTMVTGQGTSAIDPTGLYPSDPNADTTPHTSSDYVSALSSYLKTHGMNGVRRSEALETAFGQRGVSVYGWN
jgi:hypothetical protein